MAFETPIDGCKKTHKTRTIKESMAWWMIFMSTILKKRALSKVNFQPVHALKIPESAFACTCKQKRGWYEKSFQSLYIWYCLKTDGNQRTLTFKQIWEWSVLCKFLVLHLAQLQSCSKLTSSAKGPAFIEKLVTFHRFQFTTTGELPDDFAVNQHR